MPFSSCVFGLFSSLLFLLLLNIPNQCLDLLQDAAILVLFFFFFRIQLLDGHFIGLAHATGPLSG